MAELIRDDVVLSLSNTEVAALVALFDNQAEIPPALNDLNNTLQTL